MIPDGFDDVATLPQQASRVDCVWASREIENLPSELSSSMTWSVAPSPWDDEFSSTWTVSVTDSLGVSVLIEVGHEGSNVRATYAYDALGRKVKVDGTSSSTWTVSAYAGMDPVFERDHAGGITKYVYAAGMRIARIDCTPANPPVCATLYFLSDHQGSTRKVLDSAGGELVGISYDPFGEASISPSTATEPYRFTSEKHDPTGLVYLRARMYDPELGRFVSAIRGRFQLGRRVSSRTNTSKGIGDT
jgi:RHS repeat-associated protein